MAITSDRVREIFKGLENGDGGAFFERVADDVDWIVMGGFDCKGRRSGSRTSFSGDREERHALRQSLLLGSLFPKRIDRKSSRIPRLGDGRPFVRGESDRMIGTKSSWRRGAGSNRRIKVLQTIILARQVSFHQ